MDTCAREIYLSLVTGRLQGMVYSNRPTKGERNKDKIKNIRVREKETKKKQKQEKNMRLVVFRGCQRLMFHIL